MSQYNKINQPVDSLIDDNFVENDEDTYILPDQPSSAAAPPPTNYTNPQTSNKPSNMFKISFYRQYFDLDSDEFFNKIQKSLNPFTIESGQINDESQELYGFIWITGTLIFFMFVSSTGSNILSEWIHSTKDSKYNYNFDLIFSAMSLFYGYNILVPFLLYVGTSYGLKFPQPLSLIKVISIYGYTNILWIPITLLNLIIVVLVNNEKHGIVLNVIEWLIVSITGAITGLSNLRKITPVLKENCLLLKNGDALAANKLFMAIVVGLIISHTLFTVVVKISFFGIKS